MSKDIYAWLSGMCFLVPGEILQSHNKSWFSWWDIPVLVIMIVGYVLMDVYANRYQKEL